jgi:predicted negative regulator of RcsB-dependent stress response
MYIDWDIIIKVGAVITALTAVLGVVIFVVRWFNKQNQQTTDIAELKKHHEEDMQQTKDKEAKDIQELRDELCVLSYGMLAALDGLKQLHCNGEVTKAHEMLSKHLNKQAHGQHNG